MNLTIEELNLNAIENRSFPVYWYNTHYYVFKVLHNYEYIGLFAFWVFRDVAEIRRLHITESQRSKGYAKFIINHLQSEAKKKNVHTLYVHDEVKDFWMKYGFVHNDNVPKWLFNLPNVENKKATGFLSKEV